MTPGPKRKVAFVIPRYYPVFGGAENQCRLLSRWLCRSEEVEIPFLLTKRISRELKRRERVENVEVHRLGFGGLSRWSEYWFYLCSSMYLFFNRHRFDIIHCHATSVIGFVMTVVGRIIGRPVLLKLSTNGELVKGLENLQGEERIVERFLFRRLRKGMTRFTVRHATVVALNAEGMEELDGAEAPRAVLIPNGVDTEAFRPPTGEEKSIIRGRYGFRDDDILLLFAGRFVERKGIDVLLEGFRTFKAVNPERRVFLCLAGSGELQGSDVGSLVGAAASAKSGIVHLGAGNEVVGFYKMADAFVSASRNEGLPNVVLEALAVGLSCVLSDIAPHREVLGDHCPNAHVLFASGNANALAEALERCCQGILAGRSGSRPWGQVDEKYRIEAVARRYVELYEDVASEA